jgi:hypothetical protein
MYDGPDESANNTGPITFDKTSHLMQLYDVGMTSNLISDMQALVEVSTVLTQGSSPSRARALSQVQTLNTRIAELTKLVEAHLWDEESKIFCNKRPVVMPLASASVGGTDEKKEGGAVQPRAQLEGAGEFYRRFSPTSFYPMMAGAATIDQATAMMSEHLMHPGRFCVRAPDAFPPTPEEMSLPKDGVLLQTWAKNPPSSAAEDEVTCVFPCATFAAAGYHFKRNESVAYSTAEYSYSGVQSTTASVSVSTKADGTVHGMVPVYLYKKVRNKASGGQASDDDNVIGTANFSAAAAAYSNRTYSKVGGALFYVNPNVGGGSSGDLAPPTRGMWPLDLWYSPSEDRHIVSASPDSNIAANNEAGGGRRGYIRQVRIIHCENNPFQASSAFRHTLIRSATHLPILSFAHLMCPYTTTTILVDTQYRLGWARPLPDSCYFGLPSITFDDPAFATPGGFVYWRGRGWAPLALLVYWGLANPAYENVTSVNTARKV